MVNFTHEGIVLYPNFDRATNSRSILNALAYS
jgi:hypothetical protein